MWNIFKTNVQSPATPNANLSSIVVKDENETYHQYGMRVCGIVTGSSPSLTTYLASIINIEKSLQQQNQQVQARLKQEIDSEIAALDGDMEKKELDKTGIETQIEAINNKKEDAKRKLAEAKAKDGQLNKMARVKLIIGLIILSILTVYLFIFYSSTFYSAFLYQPNTEADYTLGTAMLNSRALGEAFQMGFGPFVFVVTAPIIFLGLGYCLHYFMVQKGGIKWFKITALLFITLSFDCILAYKIAELMYSIKAIGIWGPVDPFTMNMAVADINSWAVIFCGFIVYLIWGIVFDMIMTAYEDLRSNRHEINRFESQLSDYNGQITQLRQNIVDIDGELAQLLAKKKDLLQKQNHTYLVDNTRIKAILSQFFAGWITLMSAINISHNDQIACQEIYDQAISQLNK